MFFTECNSSTPRTMYYTDMISCAHHFIAVSIFKVVLYYLMVWHKKLIVCSLLFVCFQIMSVKHFVGLNASQVKYELITLNLLCFALSSAASKLKEQGSLWKSIRKNSITNVSYDLYCTIYVSHHYHLTFHYKHTIKRNLVGDFYFLALTISFF